MKKRLLWLVVSVVVFNVVRTSACAERDDDEARLAYLDARISRNELPGFAPAHPFDGEWTLGTLSMASVAATNLAMRHPETRPARAKQVSDWAARLASPEVRAYDTKQWGRDALTTLEGDDGHAGYLGHVLLAMDAACLLGGARDEALHEAVVEALARRIDSAPTGLIETYPRETYVPDNVVVVAGLVQFDACVGEPRHRALVARWLTTLRAQWLDPESGLLVFAPGQPARGSGAAWNSFYLPFIDEAFATEQSEAMWKTFGDDALFGWLRGVREWPRGTEGGGDVDSGPLVAGISPSATGFVLADATLRSRPERAGLLRTAELVGVSWSGRYLTSPLVGDAIVLAAKTRTTWKMSKSSQSDLYGGVVTP